MIFTAEVAERAEYRLVPKLCLESGRIREIHVIYTELTKAKKLCLLEAERRY